jgi:hypothetical protein
MLPPRYGSSGPYEYDWKISLASLAQSSQSVNLVTLKAELEQAELDIRGDITQLREAFEYELEDVSQPE